MLVADPLSFAHIEDNEVSHNGRRGVTAQKAGCFLLLRNRVRHNGNIGVIGIGPWDKQHVLQIWDNDISENLAAGVWVQRGDANMLRNRVRRNRDSGLWWHSARVRACGWSTTRLRATAASAYQCIRPNRREPRPKLGRHSGRSVPW